MSSQNQFHDASTSFSTALRATIDGIGGETITLRRLIEAIGEQGLLLLCGFASLPFLLPVSIPGVSTVFGLAIVLAALAITLNRLPWLPRRVLDRELPSEKLRAALRRGLDMVAKFERFVRPRLTGLTRTLCPDAGDIDAAQAWAGLRPCTPGNVPLIGRSRIPGLWYNTGHGSLGWTLACGSARLLADLVDSGSSDIEFPYLTGKRH